MQRRMLHKNVLVIFIVRSYRPEDVEKIIAIYSETFSSPPWDERWDAKRVRKRLEQVSKLTDFSGLVAQDDSSIVGFVWGYAFPFDRMPYLAGIVSDRAIYGADIAVEQSRRCDGIGLRLLETYDRSVEERGFPQIITKTLENTPMTTILEKQGYCVLQDQNGNVIRNPKRESSVYFSKEFGDLNGGR